MTISFDIPMSIEQRLRLLAGDASQYAKEAFLVELYRRRSITHFELGTALGLARLEVDEVLKRHGVPLDLTPEVLRSEIESLRESSSR